jgi:hypothetical protein
MKLFALLSWFDEDSGWLADVVRGLALINVDHLLAVDGAYALFPGARAQSPQENHDAIRQTARECGLGLSLTALCKPWRSEVEKRSFMFSRAERMATPNVDWYMVVDADTIVTKCPFSLKRALSHTDKDAAEAMFRETALLLSLERVAGQEIEHIPADKKVKRTFPRRMFFRAIPGLRCWVNHYTYGCPDGRVLWGDTRAPLVPALKLHNLEVEHRTAERTGERRRLALDYYRERDEKRIEFAA